MLAALALFGAATPAYAQSDNYNISVLRFGAGLGLAFDVGDEDRVDEAQGASSPGAEVPYLPITEFGRVNVHKEPIVPELSASEAASMTRFIEGLGEKPFPEYLYSGCQERAQAAYMLVPEALKSKVMKIWVVTPAVYTAGMRGSIRLKRNDAAAQAVNWGHHVALAFRQDGEVKVYDPVLKPDKVLDHSEWLNEMKVSPWSFWTLTDGSVYLFYDRPLAASDFAVSSTVWTGNTSDYSGKFASEHWVPRNIARDAVGVEALAGRACPALTALAKEPVKLLEKLRTPSPSETTECASSLSLFKSVQEKWVDRLD